MSLLHLVQFVEIKLHSVHSGGHMWHIPNVELSMELEGQEVTQTPYALRRVPFVRTVLLTPLSRTVLLY